MKENEQRLQCARAYLARLAALAEAENGVRRAKVLCDNARLDLGAAAKRLLEVCPVGAGHPPTRCLVVDGKVIRLECRPARAEAEITVVTPDVAV